MSTADGTWTKGETPGYGYCWYRENEHDTPKIGIVVGQFLYIINHEGGLPVSNYEFYSRMVESKP